MSSRSANDRYLPDSGFAAGLNIAGGIPPASRNHLVPTGCDNPALSAATSLLIPPAIYVQNSCRSLRVATGGRPGDRNGGRPHRSDRRFFMPIATSSVEVLRRPVESTQYLAMNYTQRLAEAKLVPSVGSVGDSYDNALAETINGLYKADVIWRQRSWPNASAVEMATLNWVEWFNNHRLFGPIGYIPPAEAEANYYATLETLDMVA